MPCRDIGPTSDSYDNIYLKQQQLDTVTNLLCTLVNTIKKTNPEIYERMTPELKKWATKHKDEDIKRVKEDIKRINEELHFSLNELTKAQNQVNMLNEINDSLNAELKSLGEENE